MNYPRITVETEKIKENAQKLIKECSSHGVGISLVSKLISGHRVILKKLEGMKFDYIADSRIENLISFENFPAKKKLIRIPMDTEIEVLIAHADCSLVSELETIKLINSASERIGKIFEVILMVDKGDLREGIFEKEEVFSTISETLKMKNVKLVGIGANFACFGGIAPDERNLGELVELRSDLEKEFGIEINLVSGGNSSSLRLMRSGGLPVGVNNLRLGSSVLMGIGINDLPIEGLNQDAFTFEAKIVEIKTKPSIPIGQKCLDAFGKEPVFFDMGYRKRAIVAVGKQDVPLGDLVPREEGIVILGGSSDHTILDVTDCKRQLSIGDIIRFDLDYGGVLSAMTSKYVYKNIK